MPSTIHTHHDKSHGRVPPAGLRRTKVMGRFRKMLREMTRQLEPDDARVLLNEAMETLGALNPHLYQACHVRQKLIIDLDDLDLGDAHHG